MAPEAAAKERRKHIKLRKWRPNHFLVRLPILFRAMCISTGKYTTIGQYPMAPISASMSVKKGRAKATTVSITTKRVLQVSLKRFILNNVILLLPNKIWPMGYSRVMNPESGHFLLAHNSTARKTGWITTC
ncbi:hypothetical protein PanWU01x14_100290, partial [Parasponia andersonii]